jgi:hypothetical protein
MSRKDVRKTPTARETKRGKQPLAAPRLPAPAWLPHDSGDFAAWGRAADRADAEFALALKRHRRDIGDEKLVLAVDNARLLMWYTLERAYPAGFWEGLADLHSGKANNLEIYIAFLEADCHFHRSGYAKAEAIRGLKRVSLTSAQKLRLQEVVLRVVDKGFRREFRAYCHLARHIQSPDWLEEVRRRLLSTEPGQVLRARWVMEACLQK